MIQQCTLRIYISGTKATVQRHTYKVFIPKLLIRVKSFKKKKEKMTTKNVMFRELESILSSIM